MQLAICAVIYIIFYLIKNTNYIFSEDVINRTKEILSYDINWNNLQNQITLFIDNNKNKFSFLGITENNQNIAMNEINNEVNSEGTNVINEISTNTVGGIGGASDTEKIEKENKVEDEEKEKEPEEKKSQKEIDVEYIKEKYNLK